MVFNIVLHVLAGKPPPGLGSIRDNSPDASTHSRWWRKWRAHDRQTLSRESAHSGHRLFVMCLQRSLLGSAAWHYMLTTSGPSAPSCLPTPSCILPLGARRRPQCRACRPSMGGKAQCLWSPSPCPYRDQWCGCIMVTSQSLANWVRFSESSQS